MSIIDRAKTAARVLFGYEAIANTRYRRTRGVDPLRGEEVELQGYDRDRLVSTLLNLKRNDPVAKAISRLRRTDVVGGGIIPQPSTGDDSLDDQIGELWAQWSAMPEVTCTMDMTQMQQEIADAPLFFGDIGVLLTRGGRVQLIEGDRIGSPTLSASESNPNKNGVIVGPAGKPRTYQIGDRINGTLKNFRDVPARNFLLFYKRMRPQQWRGIPELAPCVNSLQDVREYEAIEMISAKVSASLAAVIKRQDSVQFELSNRLDANDQDDVGRLERFETGKFHYLEPNESIETISANGRPNVDGIQFVMYHLRKVGAAVGIPVEMIMSTIGESSFSASQGLILQYQSAIEDNQRQVAAFLNRIYRWKLGQWVANGMLTPPQNINLFSCRWQTPAFRWVNKAAQVKADAAYVQMGAQSLDDVASQFGYTAEASMRRKAQNIRQAKQIAEEFGLNDWRDLFNQYNTTAQTNLAELMESGNEENATT